MGLFRDSRDRRDLSLKVCWTLAVWLMTQQLRWDVNEADQSVCGFCRVRCGYKCPKHLIIVLFQHSQIVSCDGGAAVGYAV